jgi:NifB/MoaA-like Fe-S oxidoreductase
VLEETLLGVLDRFHELATLGVVPLGVSAHSREADLRPHTPAEAGAVVDTAEAWQTRFQAAVGRRLVFAADEYYLMARRPFPASHAYDGFPQHENGIGMARSFETEVHQAVAAEPGAGEPVAVTGTRSGFFAWVDGAPADGYRAPRAPAERQSPDAGRGVAIVTGEYGRQVLTPLLPLLRDHCRTDVRVLTVPNHFFGGNIGVTGLLTAGDVATALAHEPDGDRYLLPDVVLSRGRFLDGGSVDDLPRTVEIVPTDGASLVAALR